MVRKNKAVIWSKEAVEELSEIHTYIKKQSPTAAQKVINQILSHTRQLQKHWQGFRTDELKEKNDGSYRVTFVYHYRITFRIQKEQIHVLRIRHTSREPLEH